MLQRKWTIEPSTEPKFCESLISKFQADFRLAVSVSAPGTEISHLCEENVDLTRKIERNINSNPAPRIEISRMREDKIDSTRKVERNIDVRVLRGH